MENPPQEKPQQQSQAENQRGDQHMRMLTRLVDPRMQYTYDQMLYIIEQNFHMLQYMVDQRSYQTWHIYQLNILVNKMNLDDESGQLC